jgi:glyoxylase-like metal-dependent hydrolase (beta-lactamase superfamily II)
MNQASRRAFLKTLGVFAASPTSTTQPVGPDVHVKRVQHRTFFTPVSELKKLSENLYSLEDTCNVYLIREGSRGILIDFGSGKILDYLPGLGISKIEWVLHTHHHRDQCQGDYKAVERSIPIAVPAHERHLFADAENFWRNRRVFHLYYVRNDFNTITENIPVASVLHDYGTFRWNNATFSFFPPPATR